MTNDHARNKAALFILLLLFVSPHVAFAHAIESQTSPREEAGVTSLLVQIFSSDKTIAGLAGSLLNGVFAIFTKIEQSAFAPPDSSGDVYPEIRQVLASSDVTQQSEIYLDLLKRIGAEEGQDALYRSGLPFTGETHLIQHTAGTYIYETYGLEGVTKCKMYFLGACYHEFFIHLLAEEGIETLPDVMKECRKLGPLNANQCAHGMGHGLVVWYGYDKLDKAAAHCEMLKERDPEFPDLYCYEGVFMENQWGLHPGATVNSRWLSETDPYYPCSDPRIKPQWQTGCWMNQGSLMFNKNEGDIRKTSDACLAVEDSDYRRTCFNNLARQLHPLTKGKLIPAIRMCDQLDPAWQEYCLSSIAVSDFANGGRGLSYEICPIVRDDYKAECYGQLFHTMSTYMAGPTDTNSFCAPITESEYKQQCLLTLRSSL